MVKMEHEKRLEQASSLSPGESATEIQSEPIDYNNADHRNINNNNTDSDQIDLAKSSGTSNAASPPSPPASVVKRKKGGNPNSSPYIPSYMDLSNGPEPCVVCGDAATGYHYRCMTCEGCKGFFRRTIQKNLKYHCKWNCQCKIDKNTRNQCQQCRFTKCISVGMATDLVLNEKQRLAKRKLIEENRQRRRDETQPNYSDSQPSSSKSDTSSSIGSVVEFLSESESTLITAIVQAFESSATTPETLMSVTPSLDIEAEHSNKMWQYLAEVITPSIVKVVDFAKAVPGFESLDIDDRVLLLKSCCMEIMCLRAACRYNNSDQSLTLTNGYKLYKNKLNGSQNHGISMLMAPIFEFAHSISRLSLDSTEIAMLAAVLLMQSDRTGLKNQATVDSLQEKILAAFNRYICLHRKHSIHRWATILMKVTDLRSISAKHAERVLAVKLDKPTEIPSFVLDMFDEGDSSPSFMTTLSPPSRSEFSPMISPYLRSSNTPGFLCPLGFFQTSDFPELPPLSSPMLQSPSLLTTVSSFWMTPNLPKTSLPVTPQTPAYFNFQLRQANTIPEFDEENGEASK